MKPTIRVERAGLYNLMAANGLTKFADELEGLLTIGNPMVLSLCTIDLLGSDPKEDARQIAQRDRLACSPKTGPVEMGVLR